jgi:transposase
MRKPYPTDLSDAEWNHIEPHLPAPNGYGRPRTHSLREILDAVFYVLKSGCQWRLLPHDFLQLQLDRLEPDLSRGRDPKVCRHPHARGLRARPAAELDGDGGRVLGVVHPQRLSFGRYVRRVAALGALGAGDGLSERADYECEGATSARRQPRAGAFTTKSRPASHSGLLPWLSTLPTRRANRRPPG